ncbi:UDP-glucose 4-epimerase [Thermaurantimonas aggregans]|uniref:UDP-glucose 4-epimerase n=1 Tax=Thermaurantimonas aggregans TaxID=2173829 RepID=A0A401XKQ1_9FLAO|nr:UDP-glucose 4-epimerase GalE [Thermaurantimonas aggregans]MCX8147888.1 UDP-glucose 4-epimerase GalE [Thermaurantimonas aggregans]GCD77551.1 UDP-glucose 4-epimerase [Thermaurantimonas aggregans]
MSKKILVTGGLGYIGSHTAVQLIEHGFEPIIIDNLSESPIEVKDRIEKIVGRPVVFEKVEMCNKDEMNALFTKYPDLEGAIHFAAFLLVNESVEKPLKYYYNNLVSTINLLECMAAYKIRNVVFSSSCTVYGNPDKLPVSEDAPVKPAESPYGNTKKMSEEILRDTAATGAVDVISLRYFNPIGAHESGIIGEFQDGPPHHLVPYITETAIGKRPELKIFGGDYNTPDGTCIRDYIHVVDIADAHIYALNRMLQGKMEKSFEVYNLGTGEGYSVLQMVKAFEEATGIAIPYRIVDRRPGDVEAVYADTRLANEKLGWKAKYSLVDMLRSAWKFEQSLMHQ